MTTICWLIYVVCKNCEPKIELKIETKIALKSRSSCFGKIEENMVLSCIHLAVKKLFKELKDSKQTLFVFIPLHNHETFPTKVETV